MLNLHRLAVLLEVEQHGTLAAAARALAYSPSAVSQQLTQLEREAGVALTEPVGRGIRLTDAARVLVAHARAAIAQLEQAEAELAALRGEVTGRLRVAAFQTGLLSLLPGALTRLEHQHPQLRIDVAQREAADATSGLLAGTFDIVIAISTRHEIEIWWLQLIGGIIELALGFWAAGYYGRSAVLLVAWVAAFAIVRGVRDIVLAFRVREIQHAPAV